MAFIIGLSKEKKNWWWQGKQIKLIKKEQNIFVLEKHWAENKKIKKKMTIQTFSSKKQNFCNLIS